MIDSGPALFLRVVLALIAVIALIWIIGKRSGTGRPTEGAALSVIARQSLTRGASVALVAINGRRLVVGVTDHGVALLAELDEVTDLTPAPAPAVSPSPVHRESVDLDLLGADGLELAKPPLLAGSVFSAATWRQMMDALRLRTVRR